VSRSESKSSNLFVNSFLVLLSALCVVGIIAVIVNLVSDDEKTDHEVSWLYSQTADSAELIDNGDGTFQLIMRDVDYHTIQFSDRPDRLVEIIDTADLVEMWDVLFETSSPNAVLVEHEPDGSTDSLVVVLENPQFDYEADELTYEITILADEAHPERVAKLANAHAQPPVKMSYVSLFIDSVRSASGSGAPIFTGPGVDALLSKLGLPSIPTQPLDLGGGVYILSADATVDGDGKVTAQAVVGFDEGSFTLNMTLDATDTKNWTLTTTTGNTTPWTNVKVPGLTIDPSTFSGTISSKDGKVSFDLVSSTHSWQIATGASYVSTLSFSSACPLSAGKCPASVSGPFISMNGSLTISEFPNVIAMTGAMSTNGDWARFDGNAGNLTFAGNGITNATLTMWRGARDDSFDPNMQLPSLAKLTNGNNLEFCGGLTINIPKIVNKSTNGCARWSPSGAVIGQVGVGATVNGTLPTTGSSGAATAEVAGVAFTNIASSALNQLPSRDAIMSGVANAVQSQKLVLAGRASLPGVVADALNIKLNTSKLEVDIRGEVSTSEFKLAGDIPTKINIGSEPFKITIKQMQLSVDVETNSGASFSIGTAGDATVGYAPSTRTLSTSVQLVAATSPQTGMSLSVNARGTPAPADTGRDGLTTATRLSNPSGAQYVWPNQFGIKGLNLWNLTVQIAFVDGSPALGYSSTTYMDPNGAQTKNVLKCSGPCDNDDWMLGSLGFNVSFTNPCFAYGFSSGSGTSGFAIDGGVMTATTFKVGVAPAGCSIQSGNTQQSLPVAFAGFQFSAEFGDSPRTTVNVATQVSVDGFIFNGQIANLKIAGMTYTNLQLNVSITDTASNVYFDAVMSSGMGNMNVNSQFAANSTGMTQTLNAALTDWGWKKSGTINLKTFTFNTSSNIPLQGGCASFSTAAQGQLTVGSRDYTLEGAQFNVNCNGVQKLYLKVLYQHKVKWNGVNATGYFELDYPKVISKKSYLYGDVGFSYKRHFSKKYKDRTFSRDVSVAFDMSLTLDPGNPAGAGFSFEGDFDADRVSGAIGCSMDPGGADFTCGGRLRLNPSWAGVYHFDWGDM